MSVTTLRGAGGSSGGSSFTQKPDTLRSADQFELCLGLGAGRWKGLSKGLKSLFLNDVPFESSDGTANFKDTVFNFADGDPTQTQIVKFRLGAGSTFTGVGGGSGTQLTNTNASSPGDWVTAAITIPGIDHIDLRFLFQALYAQTTKGVFETTATIDIQMLPSGSSTWINIFAGQPTTTYSPTGNIISIADATHAGGGVAKQYLSAEWFDVEGNWDNQIATPTAFVVTGKTTSNAVRQIKVVMPTTGIYLNKTWQVRCRLRELDSVDNGTNDQQKRTILWESVGSSMAASWGAAPEWRGLVWGQLYGYASNQLNGVPAVSGVFDTKICAVPPSSVYNPATRQYTGAVWDGSYDYQYVNDPAWAIKAIIEDPISGVAALSPGSTLNKWDALEASKMFSELVPDGHGGTEPRFSMNLALDQPQAVDQLIQYMAGAVNALAWEEDPGQWRMKVAKAENPVALYTPENIVGEFVYSHTDVDTRANDITMTFLNEDLNFVKDFVRDFNQADIDARGRVPISVVAVGCNKRQEALRRLSYRLDVSLNETRMVSFSTNRQGHMAQRYDTILVADPDLGAVSTTGRLTSMAGTVLGCRDTVRLEVGVAYQIVVTYPNPDYTDPNTTTAPGATVQWRPPTLTLTRNITNTSGQRGDVTALYVDAALPASTPAFATFALSATGLPAIPLAYQVIDITQGDDLEQVTIIALNIYSPKWANMDTITESAILTQIPNPVQGPPTAPTTGMFSYQAILGTAIVHSRLEVTWDRPAGGGFLRGFRVDQSLNGGAWITLLDLTQDTNFELTDPALGKREFRIYAISRSGTLSLPLTGSYTINEATFRNIRGTLAARPATALLIGDRYTTSDQSPNYVSVWSGTAWQDEANLVTQGSQIGVANGATRNAVTYSATVPSTPVDGDLWVDNSGTYVVFKLRTGGAWVTGATALTAYTGLTGRPIALADINTTESTKLAGVDAGATKNADGGNYIRDPLGYDWATVGSFVDHTGTGANLFDQHRLRLPPSASGTYCFFSGNDASAVKRYPVTAGETFYGALWAYREAGATTAQMLVNLYDAALNYISTNSVSGTAINSATVAAGGWVYIRGSLVIPAGVAYVLPHAGYNGAGSTGNLYVAVPYWGKQQPGADVTATVLTAKGIADGATVGAKLGTNLLDSSGATLGDNDVKNSKISGVNLLATSAAQFAQASAGVYGTTVENLMQLPGNNPQSIKVGDVLTMSAFVEHDTTCQAAGQYAVLYLYCYDVANVWLNSASISTFGQASNKLQGAATLTVPANTVGIGVGIYHNVSPGAGIVDAALMKVERGPVATQYAAGSAAFADITNYGDTRVSNAAVTMSPAGVLTGAGGGAQSITSLSSDNLADGATYGRYALTERTKLGGVATGATANQTDATTNTAIASAATTSTWSGTSNRPANLASLAGNESFLNDDLTLGNDGFLRRVGGVSRGQVTIGGLGYTGALNATANQSDATTNSAIATAATTATYAGLSGTAKPVTYLIASTGYSASGMPRSAGFYNGDGSSIFGAAAGYNVGVFVGGNWTRSNFWPYAGGTNASDMAAYLNGLANGTPVVICTADEPQTGRLTAGLDAAMYRCGASQGKFGNPNFQFRDAYVLVGQAGIGTGNGNESLAGVSSGWVSTSAVMVNGTFVLAGSAVGALAGQNYVKLQSTNGGLRNNADTAWLLDADVITANGTANDVAYVNGEGSAALRGRVTTAATTAVYSSVSGTPTTLGAVNAVEGAKLTGIDAGATKNADGGNYIRDPLGYDWAATGSATVEHNTGGGNLYDQHRAQIAGSSGGSYVIFSSGNDFRRYPVTPGEKYFGALWAFRVAGATTAQMLVNLYDAAGNSLPGGTATIPGTAINSTSCPAPGWTYLSGAYTIPSGVAYVLPHAGYNGGSTGSIYVAVPYWGKHQPGSDVTAAVLTAKNIADGATANQSDATTNTAIGAAAMTSTWAGTSNRPANLASLAGNESFLNDDLTLSGDGFLRRVGGVSRGQVTIGGLGYIGALNATANQSDATTNGAISTAQAAAVRASLQADNVIRNSALSVDGSDWSFGNGYRQAASSTAWPSPVCIHFTANGGGLSYATGNGNVSVPKRVGNVVYLSAYTYSDDIRNVGYLYLHQYDGTGAYIGAAYVSLIPSAAGAFEYKTAKATLLSNCASVLPQIYVSGTYGDMYVWLPTATTVQTGADVTATVLTAKNIADGATANQTDATTNTAIATAATTANLSGVSGAGLLAGRNRIVLQAAEGGIANQANDTWLLDSHIVTALGTANDVTYVNGEGAAALRGRVTSAATTADFPSIANVPARLGAHPYFGGAYLDANLIAYDGPAGNVVGALKPAEAGANVTETRIAAGSNALGGVSATTTHGNIATAGTTSTWAGTSGTGKPFDNADVTALSQVVVTKPIDQAYTADYLGAIPGGLSPCSVRVTRGGASIKLDDGTTYVATLNGSITGSIDNTNGSATKGDFTPATFTANSASVDVVVTVGGVAQPKVTIVFTKNLGTPPVSGGAGAKNASAATTNCSYTSFTAITATMTVALASGESLFGTAALDYDLTGTTVASRTAAAKWQYSVAGAGVWNDFASAANGSAASAAHYVSGEYTDPISGHVDVNQTIGGLSAGNYDVQVVAALNATGRTVIFAGTCYLGAHT